VDLMVELNKIVNEYVQMDIGDKKNPKQFDISKIDFELLGREFAKAKRKNLLLRDLQELLNQTTALADDAKASAEPPAVVIVAHGRLLRTLIAGLLHVCCGKIALGNTAVSRLDWIGNDEFNCAPSSGSVPCRGSRLSYSTN